MTRGIRNNNPCNLRWGQPWEGLLPETQRTDPDFCQFIDPTYGIRAASLVLHTYGEEGITTLRDVITRYAPSSENDTLAYINAVSTMTGIKPDVQCDFGTYETQFPVIKAIIYHENGMQPYPDAVINKGLSMAGIEDQT